MNQYDLSERTAVVTGGAQGIGYEVAKLMLKSGSAVTIWDLDAGACAGAKETLGVFGNVRIDTLDITDAVQVESAADRMAAGCGRIDILVHSAGGSGPEGPASSYSPEDWRRVIDLNLNGTFYVNQSVIRRMIKNKYGRIVNISSIAALEGPARAPAYAAAKAGVISITKSLARETALLDIAVNSISPAAVKTRFYDGLSERFTSTVLSKIARGRFLTVEETASMVCWLVSQENSFTTGENFNIAGART